MIAQRLLVMELFTRKKIKYELDKKELAKENHIIPTIVHVILASCKTGWI